jgi:hypothetical protein
MENVANVKMLPVPVFNTNEAWGRVMGWSGERVMGNGERKLKIPFSNSQLELASLHLHL